MLNAVWAAVIVAAAAWVILAAVAIVLLIRLSRLASEAAGAVSDLRLRGEALIERGNAAVDRAGEQLARTEAITASMDEVTANMAELTGRVAALAPLARLVAASASGPLARIPALVYGVNRALAIRRGARGARGAAPAGSVHRVAPADAVRPVAPAGAVRPAAHRALAGRIVSARRPEAGRGGQALAPSPEEGAR